MDASLTFSLSLRLNAGAGAPPVAWWIDGADASIWLDEIAEWGVEMSAVKLYVMPLSIRDRAAAGVLAVPATGSTPKPSPRALPYARIAGKLFIPADAVLSPAVSDAEIAAKLGYEVAVLHPSIGLVGFEKTDVLSIADLLIAPAGEEGEWHSAIASESPSARMISVTPDQPMEVEAIVESSQGDIGTQAPQQAPGAPDESALRNLAASMGMSMAKMMSWLASGGSAASPAGPPPVPGKAAKGWREKLRRWRERRRQAVNDAMLAERERELNRLLHLLRTDPDQGLRFAVPLGDQGSRGVALPSSQLGAHDVAFNLQALGGGQPSDPWNVSNQMRQQLTTKYREAANRELQLGRHRRAAYIFAKLLGDLSSAANALKQGRFYREAAVLYRDRLNQPGNACECLEAGGLLLEAIEIYQSLKRYERAGDLYARIERPEEAAKSWRQAVEQSVSQHDHLHAAQMLEKKLASPDEAAEALWNAWPTAAMGQTCVKEFFNLLGRTGRHDLAAARLTMLRRSRAISETIRITDTLAGVATGYPDQTVRDKAADLTRVTAGEALREADSSDAATLVNSVTRLNDADRLLTRDGSRYLVGRERQKRVPPAPNPRAVKKDAVPLLRSFHLGGDVKWKAVIGAGDVFFARGEKIRELIFMRGDLAGRMQRVSWACFSDDALAMRMLYLEESEHLAVYGTEDGPDLRFAANELGSTVAIGPSPLFPCTVFAADRDQFGVIWVVNRDPSGELSVTSHQAVIGSLISTRAVDLQHSVDPSAPVYVVARGGHCILAVAEHLAYVPTSFPVEPLFTTLMSFPVTGLAATFPMARLRVAVTGPEGGVVFWPEGTHIARFGEGLFDPVATFTRTGELVAVGRGEGRIYQTTEDRKVSLLAKFDTGNNNPPLAVLPGAKLSEFAVVSAEGLVQVYAAPRQ